MIELFRCLVPISLTMLEAAGRGCVVRRGERLKGLLILLPPAKGTLKLELGATFSGEIESFDLLLFMPASGLIPPR